MTGIEINAKMLRPVPVWIGETLQCRVRTETEWLDIEDFKSRLLFHFPHDERGQILAALGVSAEQPPDAEIASSLQQNSPFIILNDNSGSRQQQKPISHQLAQLADIT